MRSSWYHNIKQALSRPTVTFAVIAVSIASRIIQLIYFFNIRLDASHQVIATKNFLEGHGISMTRAYVEDISTPVYEPLINWPPGYSLLLAPFYKLFNGNYIAAGLTLGILAAITLILVSRAILKLLDIPLYLINIATLIGGFFIYYFYFIACSDAVAISFAMIAVYYSLSLLQSTDRWFAKTMGIAIPLVICGAMKYLFIPVVLVMPVFIAWKGWVTKNKPWLRSGVISSLIVLLVLGAVLAWQKSISGTATYISAQGRGFYPDHLLSFFPFIPGSFIKPDTAEMIIPGSNFGNSFVLILFQLLHVITLIVVSFFLFRKILRQGIGNSTLPENFFYFTLFVSWAITLLLAVLSLRVEKENWQSGHLWTYIEEQRYYALPIVMIQLAVFVYYHHYRERFSRAIKCLLVLLVALMIGEVVRGVIFDAKRIYYFGKEEYSWQSEYKLQQYADNLIKQSLKKQAAEQVVVGGPFYYINHRISLYSSAALLEKPGSLNDLSSLKTQKTTLLIVILRKADFETYQPFLNSGIEVAGQFNGLYFYSVYVNPR